MEKPIFIVQSNILIIDFSDRNKAQSAKAFLGKMDYSFFRYFEINGIIIAIFIMGGLSWLI